MERIALVDEDGSSTRVVLERVISLFDAAADATDQCGGHGVPLLGLVAMKCDKVSELLLLKCRGCGCSGWNIPTKLEAG